MARIRRPGSDRDSRKDRRNRMDRNSDPLSMALSHKKKNKFKKLRDMVSKNEERSKKKKHKHGHDDDHHKKKHKHKHRHHHEESAPRKLKFTGGDDDVKTPDLVETDMDDLKKFEPKIILHRELKDLVKLAVKAKDTYSDLPDGENASSVTMLLRELRDYTMEIYGLTQEDKDGIFDQFEHKILRPMITKVVRAMTSEYDSLRTQMIMALGDKSTSDVERILKTSFKNFGPMFKTEYKSALKTAKEVLGSEVDVEPLLETLNRSIKTNSHPPKALP